MSEGRLRTCFIFPLTFRKEGVPSACFNPPHFPIFCTHKNCILPFIGMQMKYKGKVAGVELSQKRKL